MSIEKNEKQYIIFPKSKSSDNLSKSRITDERVFPNTRTNEMTAPILIPTSYSKSENDLPNITYQIYENKKDFENKKAIEDNIKEIKNEISRIETFVEKTPNEPFYGDQLKELEIELESEQSKLNKDENENENENENSDFDSFFLTRTEDIEEKSKELGNKLKEQFERSSNAVKRFENYNNARTEKKGGKRRKTRKSTNKKKNKKTRNKKPQFLYNPNDPKKSFDVYIDKNPDDTISIKYTTVNDVKLTIQKLERLYKSGKYPHKRIWQVGMIMYVRLNAMLENKKKLYPNAKNIEERYELSKKYFIFLGHRTQEKNETKRKKMLFKS